MAKLSPKTKRVKRVEKLKVKESEVKEPELKVEEPKVEEPKIEESVKEPEVVKQVKEPELFEFSEVILNGKRYKKIHNLVEGTTQLKPLE